MFKIFSKSWRSRKKSVSIKVSVWISWHGVNSTSIKVFFFLESWQYNLFAALKSTDATRCRAASGRKQHYYYRLYGVSKLRLSASYLPGRRVCNGKRGMGAVRRATRLR